MKIQLEDFKTGWYSLALGLKENDIDQLIDFLKQLKEKKSHIHIVCSSEAPGLENLEIHYADETENSNAIFAGFPIEPTS